MSPSVSDVGLTARTAEPTQAHPSPACLPAVRIDSLMFLISLAKYLCRENE